MPLKSNSPARTGSPIPQNQDDEIDAADNEDYEDDDFDEDEAGADEDEEVEEL